MSRTNSSNKKANGTGSIRKISSTRNGKEYEYWQARYTAGYDPNTGKQIQRSITGKTQKEVSQKLKQVTFELDQGTYQAPSKMTVNEWIDTWLAEYLTGVKPRTLDNYKSVCKTHIKPSLGAIKLSALTAPQVQHFINSLFQGEAPIMPKTVKNCHGVLHSALDRAVKVGYIRFNPATSCELPRIEKPELKPLDDEEIKLFLQSIKGHKLERIFFVALFTGMRQGEVLGLAWKNVDFARNTIYVRQQLQRERDGSGEYHLASPKNGKGRVLTAAPYVMTVLQEQQKWQAKQKAALGDAWEENNLVFTNEIGHYLSAQIVYKEFKRIVTSIGCKETRFHDLRHSYAVAAIQSGDDIKTVQENLGHYCAAFTLDTYAHVSASMKKASAQRMENFIKSVT